MPLQRALRENPDLKLTNQISGFLKASILIINTNFSMCGLYSFLDAVLPRVQVGDSGISTQTVTVLASNITIEREQILEETRGACDDIVGQSSQQPADVSDKTSANEIGNVKEAPPGGNCDDSNVCDAEHTTPDTPEVTKKTEEIKLVVVQQTVVIETRTEIVENPSTLHEKNDAVDDRNNSSDGGVTDVDNTVQAPTEDLITNADTGHSELPVLDNQIDVSVQFDGILEDLGRKVRTENVVFEERMQKIVQQLEKEEKEGNKSDLKIDDEETNKNSGIPDTVVVGSYVDEIAREKLEAKISGNKQETEKGNSEGGSAKNLNVQGNMDGTQRTLMENKDKKIKCVESDVNRITKSTSEELKANAQVCFSILELDLDEV